MSADVLAFFEICALNFTGTNPTRRQGLSRVRRPSAWESRASQHRITLRSVVLIYHLETYGIRQSRAVPIREHDTANARRNAIQPGPVYVVIE